MTSSQMSVDSIMRKLNFTDDMYNFISVDPTTPIPCVDAFHAIGQSYKFVHGYIALVVCLFGTLANCVNLLILTQKDMRTPINLILSAMALVDVLVMVEYIPFALHMYIVPAATSSPPVFSYPWALFVLFHSHFTQILHTIAIQLTLTMAVWRYVAIRFTNQHQVNAFCTFRRCHLAILASFVLPLFICIPNYLTFSIIRKRTWTFRPAPTLPAFLREKRALRPETLLNFCHLLWPSDESCQTRIIANDDFVVDLSDLARENGGLLHIVHFWTYSVIVKLLPCVFLTFFMAYLLHTLYAAKQRHQVLQLSSAMPLTPVRCHLTPPRRDLVSNCKTCQQLTPCGSADHLTPKNSCDLLTACHHLTTNNTCANTSDDRVTQNAHLNPSDRLTVYNNERSRCSLTLAVDANGKSAVSMTSRKWFASWRKNSSPLDEHAKKAARRSDRTSRMLVAVLCLFVITELPQGVMAFLSGLYGAEFFRKCYNAFAEVWDLLALVNSSVNFLLYCFMSRQFRVHFRNFFPWNKCYRSTKKPGEGPADEHRNGNQKLTVHTTLL